MKQTIIPVLDRLLVKRTETATRTPGGIFIPETASKDDKPADGIVIAMGPGRRSEYGIKFEAPCQVGDHVIFSKYAGMDARPYNHTKLGDVAGEDASLILIRFDEVQAIVRPTEE